VPSKCIEPRLRHPRAYLTDRDYLLTVFRELANLPAAGDLFDPKHNPVWKLGPSIEGARALLDLFRAPDAETPSFRFGQADTRFLGDLYQSLDEETRERFALLQTPHFVETYILDRTLDRAIERFGLDDTTLIDPTCGSGHFLLGAFERLVDHRLRKEPGLDVREAARKAIDAVYGADINPYAVAIARFRLTLAVLEKGGYRRLEEAPALPLHLVVADSLLHNPQHVQAKLGELMGQSRASWEGKEFALEDDDAARDVLGRRFAAVVGNPPYITPKDSALRHRYAEMYSSCHMNYALTVPFCERLFQLARSGGFVGQITANSFMKREFGKKLITKFLRTVNVDRVVNTSGVYIPGHGTPTVLLFGSNEEMRGADLLTVLAKRGEPSTPDNPEQGFVWRSIADHGDEVGFDNDYISVARVPRETLASHPWSLGGGGAAELKELLESRRAHTLGEVIADIGFSIIVGEDELFLRPAGAQRAKGLPTIPIVIGELVRDWSLGIDEEILRPFDAQSLEVTAPDALIQELWPWRKVLENRVVSGSTTMKESNRKWFDVRRLSRDKHRTPLSIAFAFVATHNHFVLDRGGKVFKQSAPIIKLKDDATEEDHLALLAYLNSSTACFWMKQVFYPKASASGDVSIVKGRAEANRYEFAGTQMAALPMPDLDPESRRLLVSFARRLDSLAHEREALSAIHAVEQVAGGLAFVDAVEGTEGKRAELLRAMQVLQEDLDWCVYRAFGLVSRFAPSPSDDARAVVRPFEAAASGKEVPTAWRARAERLAESADLQLMETPVFKRLWEGRRGVFGHNVMSVRDEIRDASVDWLAERGERIIAAGSDPQSSGVLERAIASEGAAVRVIDLARESGRSVPIALDRDAVPYLAAHRHTDAGLEKRREWERVWNLQRAEDRGETVPPFHPPPRYDQKDYRDATYWRLRGKLDVPKERFISYPGCESDEDKEPVYGWAGWNHLQQAIALATLYMKRKQGEAWGKERLVPMLAGLDELLPWIWQWHPEATGESGGMKPGQYIADFLAAQCHELGVTVDELRAWRPESGRKKAGGASATGKKRGAKKGAHAGEEM
jgi:hypothetical protein